MAGLGHAADPASFCPIASGQWPDADAWVIMPIMGATIRRVALLWAVAGLSAGCASSAVSATSSSSSHAGAMAASSRSREPTGTSDPATIHRLWLLALSGARQNGGRVLRAEAVKSTHSTAVQATMGDGVQGDQPVWVLQVEGTKPFACRACRHPAAASPPAGRYLTYILDQRTFAQSDFAITASPADLSRLGPVITLHG